MCQFVLQAPIEPLNLAQRPRLPAACAAGSLEQINHIIVIVATSVGDSANSNTASFFLKLGRYTVQTAETDTHKAGDPVPFEIKTGQVVDLKVKAKAK